jgi:hypothetical protein
MRPELASKPIPWPRNFQLGDVGVEGDLTVQLEPQAAIGEPQSAFLGVKTPARPDRCSKFGHGGCVLFVPVSDPALGQIVRRHFQGHFVTIHDLDPVAPESSGHRRQNCFACVQFDRKHPSFEFLDYFPHDFNCVFFWHFPL